MPLDLSGTNKIYPDAMVNFHWQHSASGTVPANTFYKMGEVSGDGNPNHAQAKAQGFSSTVRDWKNVEQKIYFDADTSTNTLVLYMGGNGTDACQCCGFAYEAAFSSDGLVQLRKKMYHVNYGIISSINSSPLPSGFKGVALCRFNVNFNSGVRLEAWIDYGTRGSWRRVLFAVDDGFTFGNNGSKCGGTDKEAGTWGFPIVGFRSNFSYNYEKMSAREINAGGSFNEAGIAGGLARPTGGGGENPLPAVTI